MACFYEAAALDPGYALPHAGLADAFLVAALAGALPPGEAWALAGESSERALALGADIPEPHVSAGFLRLFRDWDWDGAERELRLAVDLAPESTAPHQWLGLVLDLRGRREEAASALRRAQEGDPLSIVVLALAGLHAAFEALEEHRRAFDLAPDSAFVRPVLARSLALAGRADDARALVVAAEASPYQLATVHLALGEVERAEDLLAEAARRRDPWIVILAVDPMMRPLRGRPLVETLVRRVSGGPTP